MKVKEKREKYSHSRRFWKHRTASQVVQRTDRPSPRPCLPRPTSWFAWDWGGSWDAGIFVLKSGQLRTNQYKLVILTLPNSLRKIIMVEEWGLHVDNTEGWEAARPMSTGNRSVSLSSDGQIFKVPSCK